LVAVVHTIKGFVPQVLIRFTEMLTIAMRQPAPAGEFRSSFPADGDPSEPTTPIDLPEEYTYQLHGPSLDNVVVAVDFNLAHREHHLYRVKITVIDQEQDPFSQDGHRVQISYEVNTSEQITDSSGCVSFTNIPYSALSELQITINIRSTG
jgi:hypothetical protein